MVLAYGVTKSAVHALCKNLVKEFEGTGTTINTVVPGFVETPWQKGKARRYQTEYLQENSHTSFCYY